MNRRSTVLSILAGIASVLFPWRSKKQQVLELVEPEELVLSFLPPLRREIRELQFSRRDSAGVLAGDVRHLCVHQWYDADRLVAQAHEWPDEILLQFDNAPDWARQLVCDEAEKLRDATSKPLLWREGVVHLDDRSKEGKLEELS